MTESLKVRLVPRSLITTQGVVARRAAEDLLLVLAEDFPDRIEMVAPGDDDDERFMAALINTRSEPGLELTRHEVVGTELLMLSGESYFTATHALWANEFDPPESEHGTLVAVPNRQVVLAHPIRDRGALAVLTPMLQLARRFGAADEQGTISPNLYLLRDGRLQLIEIEETETQIVLSPASEFAQLLQQL